MINWGALYKNFNGYTYENLTQHLKKYVPEGETQSDTIKNILLIRRVFRPTKDEVEELEKKETPLIKNQLHLRFNKWLKWRPTYKRCYDRKDLKEKHIRKALKRLNLSNKLQFIHLFNEEKVVPVNQNGPIKTDENTTYFTPVILTASAIAVMFLSFWAFKKFFPHQFLTLNTKLGSLFKKIPRYVWRPTKKVSLNFR